MTQKCSSVPLVIAIIVGLIGAITTPGYFRYFHDMGTGAAYSSVKTEVQSKNLSWDSMTEAEREPFRERVESAAMKCAILMTLGHHIPFYLFTLITVGLFARSISRRFRVFLRFAFFGVCLLGMFFFSLGIECWRQDIPFPLSLIPASALYLIVAGVFGAILGIGRLYRHRTSSVRPPLSDAAFPTVDSDRDRGTTS